MPLENLEFPEFIDFRRRTVPPSLHENVFEARGYEEDSLIGDVRKALLTGREAAERSLEIAASLLIDETLTEPARHQQAAAAILKASSKPMERIQLTIEKVAAKIAALETFLTGPPEPANAVQSWKLLEMRSALAAMDPAKRRKTIMAAIDKGNVNVATAVLRTEPFVIGMDETEQLDYRQRWQRIAQPRETAYLALLKDVETHLERGGKLLLSYTVSLTNSQLVQRAQRSQRRAADALGSLAA